MFQRLLPAFRQLLWPVLISLLLVQCKKAEDAPVTPTAPVTPPISTTTAPPLTDFAKNQTGLPLLAKEEYEKIPVYVAKTYKGGRRLAVTVADLSADMPPVGSQGQQGSCNAWASAYAMRSFLYHTDTKKPYKTVNGTRDDEAVFSPAFVYNQINNGADIGSYPRDAYTLMIREGVCTYKDMPYQTGYPGYLIQPTTDQKQKAANFKIAGFGRTLITTESLKACLSQNIAVQLTVVTDRNFNNPTDLIGMEYVWRKFDPASSLDPHLYHAVVLMGFDDTKNAFKLMNSWGTDWANRGFIWLDYGLVNQVVKEAYIPYTTSTLAQLAVYDPSTNYSGAGTWVQKADYLGSNHESTASVTFSIDNIIYVCGSGLDYNSSDAAWLGRADLYTYNPATNAWAKKASKLPATPEPYSGVASFVIGKKGYLITGFANDNSNVQRRLYEYDPSTDTWTAKKPLPFDKGAQRFSPVAVSYNGKGYFGLNSSTGGASYGRELWEYNPLADSWQLKTTLPADFDVGSASVFCVIDDKLYTAFTQTTRITERGNTLLYEYDFTKNTWSKKQSLGNFAMNPGYGIGAVLNGQFYCGLTYTNAGANKTSSNYLFAYSPKTDKGVQVKDLPAIERSFKLGGSANGRLYVGFGYNSVSGKGYTFFSDWWEYTP